MAGLAAMPRRGRERRGGGSRLCHVLGESGHASLRGARLCTLERELSDGGGRPEVSSARQAPDDIIATSPDIMRESVPVGGGRKAASVCTWTAWRRTHLWSCGSERVSLGTFRDLEKQQEPSESVSLQSIVSPLFVACCYFPWSSYIFEEPRWSK